MFAYFDIGGTKTRVAVSENGKSFDEYKKFNTPKNFEEGMNMIVETINTLANNKKIDAIGGGIAGPVDFERTTLINSPNLKDWAGKPITEKFSSLLSCPAYIENDSAIVALGEAHHGAGKGDDIMAYITVSTGVGGARVVNGKIDIGVYGFEPGHQYIDFDKSKCENCPNNDIEGYISGTATAHRFQKEPYEVEDPELWEELSLWLAYMLNNTIVHWSPNSVVLGGSMIVGNPAIPIERVTEHLNEICTIYSEKPIIKKASLEDLGGLYGAMEYVNQKLKNK